MFALEYTVEDGRRVLVGLSYEETAEFESLPGLLATASSTPISAWAIMPTPANSVLDDI